MINKIVLKRNNDKYCTYEYDEAVILYKDYCKNYINLKLFCSDNLLTLESGEILIKTMRTSIMKDRDKHLKSRKGK
tara:strand:- start:4401 stop:4628 length:228 start_codon:yes stop_codon:yes gene_type:complete